jgi:amidohydrolase
MAAAQIVTAVQSIVSRNVPPLDTAVVSITAINGGTAFNVIPPRVEMKGTVRTFRKEVRETVHRRLREIVAGVAEAMECSAEIIIEDVTPAVVNNPQLSEMVDGVREQVLPETVDISGLRTMGSEDMAYMMEDIPGCYIFVGSMNEEKNLVYGHHHPRFDFDEQALINGVALVSASAISLLNGETTLSE